MLKKTGYRIGLGLLLATLWASFSAHAATGTRNSAFTYDGNGLLATETVEPSTPALKLQTVYSYDSFGNITTTTVSGVDIQTRSSSSTYDAKGQFTTSQSNALGHMETLVHDARFGTVTGQTGPNNLTITFQYDSFGRKIRETGADGQQTKFEYLYCVGTNSGTNLCPTHASYLVRVTPLAADGTTQNGLQTITYYDKLTRTVGTDKQGFDGSTIRQITEYDANGRAKRASRPYFVNGGTQRWASNTYDALGRVIGTTNPDSSQSSFAFNGLSSSVTNPLSQTTTTVLNAQGKTASITEPSGRTTNYTYDPHGNMTSVTDSEGNVTTYTYDVRGNKIAMNDPDLGSWTYTYNVLGKTTSMTDAKNQTRTYTYDKIDRPTQISRPDVTHAWTYDTLNMGVGKPASATVTENGTVKYSRVPTYDYMGRVAGTTITVDGSSYTNSATYDAHGRLATLSYPSGLIAGYEYNTLGYLNHVKDNANNSTIWQGDSYDADMNLTQQTLGNGVVITRTYDPNTAKVETIKAGANDAVANFTYDFDSIGNLTSRADANQTLIETFGYDNMNRLTSAVMNGGTPKTFSYDDLGNIITKADVGTYTYPAAGSARPHAVQSITGTVNTTFAYDDNGNMVTGNGRSYTYSSANRHKTITTGGSTIFYNYDDTDQRIIQTAPEGTTTYLNDGALGMKLEKFVGTSGEVQWNEYIYAGDGPVGVRFNKTSGTQTRYYVGDHLGSIAVLTDDAGAVSERLSYDAWGKRRYPDGQDDPTNSLMSQTTRGFTNHEHISTTGLINMNARTYDPVVGRFATPDSMVEDYYRSQILNRYSYVGNNPLSFTDPTGHCFLGCFWKSQVFKSIVAIAVTIVAYAYLGPIGASYIGDTLGTALMGAVVGTASSAIMTGGDLSSMGDGAWQGALSAVMFAQVGDIASTAKMADGSIGKIAMHGAAGGVSSVARGGEFQSGFLSAGFAEFAGPHIDGLVTENVGEGVARHVSNGIARGIVGGVGSELGGGKFANGATTAAFAYAFNHLHAAMTTAAGGGHMERQLVDDDKTLLGAIGLGRAEGVKIGKHLILGDYVEGLNNEGYEFGKKGYGQIKVVNEDDSWMRIRILSTTPFEDQQILARWNQQNGKTGPYSVAVQNCWEDAIKGVIDDVAFILSQRHYNQQRSQAIGSEAFSKMGR